MDILFTINNKYIDIMLSSLLSIIINGNLERIRLHVVTSECTDEDIDKIKRFIDLYDNIELHIYRLEDNPIDNYGIPNWRGSQIANARLFYPRIIKDEVGDVENLLYIDSDTITVGDLSTLKEYDAYPINACLDESSVSSYYADELNLEKYYNSGVLYYNVNDYLNLDMEYRIGEYNNTAVTPLTFPDQDLINLLLKDEINQLPPRYNMSGYTTMKSEITGNMFYNPKIRQLSFDEIKEERKHKKILHSYGFFNVKPWTNNNVNPFNDEFMKYMEQVNPEFTKEELKRVKKLLTICPALFKTLYLIRPYLPKTVEKNMRSKSLTLQKAIDKKKNTNN